MPVLRWGLARSVGAGRMMLTGISARGVGFEGDAVASERCNQRTGLTGRARRAVRGLRGAGEIRLVPIRLMVRRVAQDLLRPGPNFLGERRDCRVLSHGQARLLPQVFDHPAAFR